MRKEYRKAIRGSFTDRLRAVAPGFERVTVDSPLIFSGETVFRWSPGGGFLGWLLLIPDSKRQAFTLEVGWSDADRFPELGMRPSVMLGADDPLPVEIPEGFVRLGGLASRTDEWWDGPALKPHPANRPRVDQNGERRASPGGVAARAAPDAATLPVQRRPEVGLESQAAHHSNEAPRTSAYGVGVGPRSIRGMAGSPAPLQNQVPVRRRFMSREEEVEIMASVLSAGESHHVAVSTGGRVRELAIPAKRDEPGSAVNGGELLFLALATCYCNDVYREAAREGLRIDRVEVTVTGTFGERGAPGEDIRYSVRVESPESEVAVRALLTSTDGVAEIQNTLRAGVQVELTEIVVG